MSITWPLRLPVASPVGDLTVTLEFEEVHDHLHVAIDYPGLTEVSCQLGEASAAQLRDWLSWWLGEGPEPGEQP